MQELKEQLKQKIACLLLHDVEQILEEGDLARKTCVETGDTTENLLQFTSSAGPLIEMLTPKSSDEFGWSV
jgi:hypothetical protein